MTAIIERILKIIEHLRGLKEYRREALRRTVGEHLRPLFDDLLAIHLDYIKVFSDTRKLLGKKALSLDEIVEMVEQRRREYEPVRVKTRSLIQQLRKARLKPDLMTFVKAVAEYFHFGSLDSTMDSATRWLSHEIERRNSGERIPRQHRDAVRDELQRCVDYLMERHRENWACVCEAYAKIAVVGWSCK